MIVLISLAIRGFLTVQDEPLSPPTMFELDAHIPALPQLRIIMLKGGSMHERPIILSKRMLLRTLVTRTNHLDLDDGDDVQRGRSVFPQYRPTDPYRASKDAKASTSIYASTDLFIAFRKGETLL